MARKLIRAVLVFSAALVLCLLGLVALDRFTRTPHRLARTISGLDVPGSARVVSFRDEPAGEFGQDLWVEIDLALSPQEVKRLRAEALREGWRWAEHTSVGGRTAEDINDFGLGDTGISTAEALLEPGSAGVFLYRRDTPSSYSIAVLDPAGKRLRVQMVIL